MGALVRPARLDVPLAPGEPSSAAAAPQDAAIDAAVATRSQGCRAHPGIRIAGETGPQGFVWNHPLTGAQEPRPGSGVTAGSGTREDPYVIAGWCLPATGIRISGTQSHVIVRGNRITGSGASSDDAGVRVEDAAHVAVEANTMRRLGYGVGVWRSAGIVITDNVFEENLRYGAWAAEADGVVIRNNTGRGNENGLGIGLCHGALVAGNAVAESGVVGILNAFSDVAVIRDNHLVRGEQGVFVREAFDVVVADNRFEDQVVNAVSFDLAPRGLARQNEVAGSGHEGIIFWSSAAGTASANRVTASGFGADRHGIRMAGSPASAVADNVAVDNAHGLVLDGSPGSIVWKNLLRGNKATGLMLWDAQQARVEHNTITANGIGVLAVNNASGVALAANNVFDNRLGIGLDAQRAQGHVDADGNWWGCVRGPGHDGCERVRGDVAISHWLRQPDQEAPEAPPRGAGTR